MVTQGRECNLGKIIDGKMVFSDFGEIVKNELIKSFEIRAELFLDTFIIMPNHIHAIIILKQQNDKIVETHGRAFQQPQSFIRKPKSISSFIGCFKSAVNSKIDDYIDNNNLNIMKYNRNNHFFQPNYHDHIIRNENEYNRISQYIIDNPIKWQNDKLNGGKGNIVMEESAPYGEEIWMV